MVENAIEPGDATAAAAWARSGLSRRWRRRPRIRARTPRERREPAAAEDAIGARARSPEFEEA
jgi:hypothetical protein